MAWERNTHTHTLEATIKEKQESSTDNTILFPFLIITAKKNLNLTKKKKKIYKLTIDLLKYTRNINITKYILLLNNFFKRLKCNSSEFGAFITRYTL